MKLTSVLVLLCVCLAANAQIPSSISGNWVNQKTNEWEYGFFDKFAIYDGDFWEYASIKEQGKKTTVSLQKGDKSIRLEIENKTDSTVSIKDGKGTVENYQLIKKAYPPYTATDNNSFSKPTFTSGSATITGYYHNFDKLHAPYNNNTFSLRVFDFTQHTRKEHTAKIDSLGRFSITIPVMNTQDVMVDLGRLNERIIVEPGSRLFLFADINDLIRKYQEGQHSIADKTIYMGDNARVNNEISGYASPMSYFPDWEDPKHKDISDMGYLKMCEDVYNERMKSLNDYIISYPAISEKFRYYNAQFEKYWFASQLMQ